MTASSPVAPAPDAPASDDAELERAVGELISELSTSFALSRTRWHRLIEELVPDLKGVNLVVLHAVMHKGPVTATELSTALDIDKATLSRQIAKLRDCDMVKAEPSPEDGRVVHLSITDEARQHLEDAKGQWAKTHQERFAGWTLDELETLLGGLRRFNAETE